ncbi:MAG: hypothetical protein ACRDT6_25480, partial [Micromonosporaceae bacterium]
MTIDQPGGVDLDLLADYAGGALQGTPDQERVAALVDSDPSWAHAQQQLTAANTLVAADLAALGPEPIPVDVAERIESALDNESGAGGAVRTVTSLDQR